MRIGVIFTCGGAMRISTKHIALDSIESVSRTDNPSTDTPEYEVRTLSGDRFSVFAADYQYLSKEIDRRDREG